MLRLCDPSCTLNAVEGMIQHLFVSMQEVMHIDICHCRVTEDEVLTIKVPEGATGDVIVNVGGKNYTGTVKDGEVIVILEERQKILTHYSDRALMLSCLPPLPSKVKSEIRQFCHAHTKVITDGCLARNNSDAMKKLLHEIRGEYPSFETAIVGQDLLDCFFVFANKDNERMKKQHGLFAIFGLNEEENVEKLERNAIRIVIPKNCKKRLLGELSLMQINSEYIYPGLERKAMLNINKRANWIAVDI